jgi:hypothetical protein
MKKIVEKIKSFCKWVANDGLQHIESIALILLSLTPIIGFGWASLVAAVAGFGREIVQYLRGKNTKEQVHHDLICNGIGYVLGCLTMAVWWLCGM